LKLHDGDDEGVGVHEPNIGLFSKSSLVEDDDDEVDAAEEVGVEPFLTDTDTEGCERFVGTIVSLDVDDDDKEDNDEDDERAATIASNCRSSSSSDMSSTSVSDRLDREVARKKGAELA
jgi:hypothetical protein